MSNSITNLNNKIQYLYLYYNNIYKMYISRDTRDGITLLYPSMSPLTIFKF